MVGVDSGSLCRSLSHLAWSWVCGRLALFYIHQMNRVNSCNGSAMMTALLTRSVTLYDIRYSLLTRTFINTQRSVAELSTRVRYVLIFCAAVDGHWWAHLFTVSCIVKLPARLHHRHRQPIINLQLAFTVSQIKYNIFGKCRPIVKILSPIYS